MGSKADKAKAKNKDKAEKADKAKAAKAKADKGAAKAADKGAEKPAAAKGYKGAAKADKPAATDAKAETKTADKASSKRAAKAAEKSGRAFEQWLAEPSGLTVEQLETVAALEADLRQQLAKKERRYRHSLSVGRTAEVMARHYGVDPYKARIAGVLHDWEKNVPDEELVGKAEAMGIELGAPLSDVKPLLHGLIASKTLAERYPWLEPDVLQAIARHTSGAIDMSPLDMVLFVADGIEPTRGPVPALEAQRDLVGESSLEGLYRKSFLDGVGYVIGTRRYLYPGTLDIYNALVRA